MQLYCTGFIYKTMMHYLSFFAGDGEYKPFVSAEPDVTTVEIDGSEDFMILACDGLWDTLTPAEATQIVFDNVRQNQG